ncbi:galactose-binding like protein, partial [Aspergillus ellipticus CBS 707.79]
REISALASWTVSTHKPGCGVAALRNPSPSQYWQSDGPQPHTLTLHFFKLVAIVRIRVYLDFEMDESYTPTKMTFLAGMGGNDLVEFACWEGEGPGGWVDNDDPYAGNVLKAMVVQMRVIENHQNGKDTHVRGFQVF